MYFELNYDIIMLFVSFSYAKYNHTLEEFEPKWKKL